LQAPSSLTRAVALLHPAPGFSWEGIRVYWAKRRKRGIQPHNFLLHTAALATTGVREREEGDAGQKQKHTEFCNSVCSSTDDVSTNNAGISSV